MIPAERYVVSCHRRNAEGDHGTLFESHRTLAQALAAIMAHAERPWDAIILTPSPRLRTRTGRELIAGGRLQ